jgi:hypothetical protein
MSERDNRPAGEDTQEGEQAHLAEEAHEGASPGSIGAVDGAAAAGSLGAVSSPGPDSEMPTSAPDPSIGPD